jgi:PDZ domain-containing protein
MVPPRRARTGTGWWLPATVSSAVLAAALIGAASVQIPYYVLEPGTARATEALIVVDGPEQFPSTGEIYYLTVGIQPTTPLAAAQGWIDPDTDIVPESFVLGDQTEEQNREQNALAMVSSKDVAASVALAHLGYRLSPSGTGATVTDITPGSAADVAALQPGDTIVAVDGVAVRLNPELAADLGARRPGDGVTLTVEDLDGVARSVPVTLGPRPDNPAVAFLGVGTGTRGFDAGLPFAVDIDSGQVGGPSAGLAFTLGILDLLTPGELTGGAQVAVTGTINPDATVGPVGGVAQKAAAAAAGGATVMLVPSAEYEAALDHAHGMRIEAVDDLAQALGVLDDLGGNALALGSPGTEAAAPPG